MKTTVSLIGLSLCLCVAVASAQADFKFERLEYDFGSTTEKDDTLWYDFKFKNVGTEPLIIKEIKTACECTLAEYPKNPIMPGKEGVIRAGYKYKGKQGTYNKTLTIFANTMPAITQLTIKGVILESKK